MCPESRRVLRAIQFAVLAAISCSPGVKTNEVEAWKGLYRVEIKELLRIGSEGLADDPYVFSGIHDLRFDDIDNLYVLDRKELVIKVFSPSGKYIKAYRLMKGQGPGEFERPLGFDIGPNDSLYIADLMLRKVTGIDQKGKHMGTMTLRTDLGQIVVDREGNVYTTGGLIDTGDQEVRKYRFPEGDLLKAFCPTNALAQWIGRVGGKGNICLSPRGNILYSFSIPYDIREFTPRGEWVRRFGRKIAGWKAPKISQQGLPDSPILSMDIDTFPDGKILHAFLDKRTKPYYFCFDIFDEQGMWLISFDARQYIQDRNGRMARIDGQGHVYMDLWEPYPHIRKYSIQFVPLRGQT